MGNSFLGRTIVNGARQQALQEPPGRDRRYRESPVAPGCAPTETRTAGESVRADAAGVRADGVRDRESDRKSVVEGKSVSVRGDLGGRGIIQKKRDHKLRKT